MSDHPEQADHIRVALCDGSGLVHIEFVDADGECFALACLHHKEASKFVIDMTQIVHGQHSGVKQ